MTLTTADLPPTQRRAQSPTELQSYTLSLCQAFYPRPASFAFSPALSQMLACRRSIVSSSNSARVACRTVSKASLTSSPSTRSALNRSTTAALPFPFAGAVPLSFSSRNFSCSTMSSQAQVIDGNAMAAYAIVYYIYPQSRAHPLSCATAPSAPTSQLGFKLLKPSSLASSLTWPSSSKVHAQILPPTSR